MEQFGVHSFDTSGKCMRITNLYFEYENGSGHKVKPYTILGFPEYAIKIPGRRSLYCVFQESHWKLAEEYGFELSVLWIGLECEFESGSHFKVKLHKLDNY